jgi:hypothetical protein
MWLSQNLVGRDASIEGERRPPIKHSGSVESFIFMAGSDSRPAEQSQNH